MRERSNDSLSRIRSITGLHSLSAQRSRRDRAHRLSPNMTKISTRSCLIAGLLVLLIEIAFVSAARRVIHVPSATTTHHRWRRGFQKQTFFSWWARDHIAASVHSFGNAVTANISAEIDTAGARLAIRESACLQKKRPIDLDRVGGRIGLGVGSCVNTIRGADSLLRIDTPLATQENCDD
jgi:hypothetical protein